jgi:hypothetical protein
MGEPQPHRTLFSEPARDHFATHSHPPSVGALRFVVQAFDNTRDLGIAGGVEPPQAFRRVPEGTSQWRFFKGSWLVGV